jgi:hypothetical protein
MQKIIRTIKAFDEELSKFGDDYEVWFDDGNPAGRIISWRGIYAEASLDHGHIPQTPNSGTLNIATVKKLRAQIQDLYNGSTLEGYKGGEFRMSDYTDIWADEYGMASQYAIQSLTFDFDTTKVIVNRIDLG